MPEECIPCPGCAEGWAPLSVKFCSACYAGQLERWIAYADQLETVLELVCGQSKDQLMKMHAEQGLRLIRPTTPQESKSE